MTPAEDAVQALILPSWMRPGQIYDVAQNPLTGFWEVVPF